MAIDKQKVSAAAQKYIKKGAFDKAIRELRKIIDQEPDDVRTLLKIGNLYSRKGDKKSAAEIYGDVAGFYESGGFHQKAVAVYKQIAKLQPDRVDVVESIAELYRAQGLIRDALSQYRSVLERYRDAQNLDGYGRALGRMCDIDPSNVGLRVRYAEHLAKQKNVNEAVMQFSTAARQLKTGERYREYIKVAERLLYHRPDDMEVLKDVVRHYLHDNEARQALAKLQALYRLDAQDHETLELLSRAFLQLNQTSKAVGVLKELARVYESVFPDAELAKRTWKKVLALDEKDSEARAALVEEISQNVPLLADSAIIALEPAGSESGEDEVERLLTEIDVCLRYNLLDQAREHLERVFQLIPDHLGGREREVRLLHAQGRTSDAAAQLREMAKGSWASDKDLALKYARGAAELSPTSEETFELLLSFGLDPAEYGVGPDASAPPKPAKPPPLPGASIARPPSLNPADLQPPPDSAKKRDDVATLPPDALIALEPEPTETTPTPARPIDTQPVPEVQDDDVESVSSRVRVPDLRDSIPQFDLSGIDEVLNLDSHNPSRRIGSDSDEFEALLDFDVDDDAIDSLFGDELITGSFEAVTDVSMDPFTTQTTPSVPELSDEEMANLQEDLAEVNFYRGQGLVNEARAVLSDLQKRYGAHPLIESVRAQLEEG